MKRNIGALWIALLCAALLTACASSAEDGPEAPSPTRGEQRAQVSWPKEKLELDENGVPRLNVYVTEEKAVRPMELETYVQGVLAGEMKNDWPLEALKAQAILARTFVLKFVQEKKSRYPDADISTDIEEAQAYNAEAVNDAIRQAVEETRGQVLSFEGELPYAWFHAHSGGATELAKAGLGWEKDEPGYTQSVKGNEPDSAGASQELKDAQAWEAGFSFEEFESALATLGIETELSPESQVTVGERGTSGRALTLNVDGQPVNAASLRIALGSTKMRSTMLTSLTLGQNGSVHMAGRGYGHGVGMSQWGAYGMAEAGKSAQDIVTHYFRDVTVETLW